MHNDMTALCVPAIDDAEGVLRDLLPVLSPDVDQDQTVREILSSVQSIINICIAAQQNPVIEKIMASIIQSFVTVRRPEELELHQQLSSFCLAEYTNCQNH